MFWQHMSSAPFFREHPILSDPVFWFKSARGTSKGQRVRAKATDLTKCIPLCVHSDDGEAHRRRSFMVVSFGSILRAGGCPWESRIVLYCTDNSRACNATFNTLDSWLCWSFTELATGRFFAHSPWNEPMAHRKGEELIADGYRGILIAFRGDEKALLKSFHCKRNWTSTNICISCHASRLSNSRYIYTMFGRNAPHRDTAVDLRTFTVDLCDSTPWVRIPGFDPSMIYYDWLHVVDLCLTPESGASVPRLHWIVLAEELVFVSPL